LRAVFQHLTAVYESDWHVLATEVMNKSLRRSQTEGSTEEFRSVIWPNLSKNERRDINAKGEGYKDLNDYSERELLTAGARTALGENFESRPLYRERIDTELRFLYKDPQMSDPSHARQRIREVLDKVNKLLHISFQLEMEAHRPVDVETERLHRRWSQLRYQGFTWEQIQAEAKAQRHHIELESMKQAVKRYRKRREPIQEMLRELIYNARYQK
jgi:hypothetical protein